MADFLDTLQRRVLLLDGAMGTQIQAPRPVGRGRLLGPGELLRGAQPQPPGPDPRTSTSAISRAGADAVETNSFGGSPITLGEFDLAERAFEINRARRRAGPRGDRRASRATAGARFVIGAIGPGTRLPSLGHIAYRTLEDAFAVQAAGPDRRRRRRDPVRDLPGPAADQGRGQRRAPRDARGRPRAAADGPGHDRDHRHHAGRHRHRRRRDHRRRAGRADHRPELRHRPAGDGRARAPISARSWPRADLGACRMPACPSWSMRPDPLSARRRASSPPGSSASSSRTASPSSAAAAAPRPSTSRALDAHAAPPRRGRRPAAAEAARGRAHRPSSPRSIPRRAAAPGERLSCRSASAATPTARRRSASARRPATGTAASRSGRDQVQARARTRSTSAPPTSAATRSPTCARWSTRLRGAVDSPLVFDSTELPVLEVGARAVRRQGGDQLDQLRGRRGAAGGAPGARQASSAPR